MRSLSPVVVVLSCYYFFLCSSASSPKVLNVAAWVEMRPRTNSTIINPACDLVSGHLPLAGRQILASKWPTYSYTHYTDTNKDVFLAYAGGNDVMESFYTDQDMWTLTRLSDTEIEWDVLAAWQGPRTIDWPIQRTGSQGFVTDQGDLVIFGGYSSGMGDNGNQIYLDDMCLFSTLYRNWTILQPRSPKGISNPGPIGRAWASFIRVPSADPNVQAFFLHGGQGSYDGDPTGKASMDFDDNWLLTCHYDNNQFLWEWHELDNTTLCIQSVTVCEDARSPVTQDHEVGDLINALLNVTNILTRPQDFTTTWDVITSLSQQLYNASRYEKAYYQQLNLRNNQSSCHDLCESYALTRPQNFPVRAEGSRAAVVGDDYYLLGGYNCTSHGVQNLGGQDCYHNSVYIYHLKYHYWEKLMQPKEPYATPEDARQSDLWPSKRAYHTMTAIDVKLYVIGGGYEDGFSVYTYYNDVHVFNTVTRLWEEIQISGSVPDVRWSASAGLVTSAVTGTNAIWYFMGCTGNQWYNDVHVLLIDQEIRAYNFNASGVGLNYAVAGETAVFHLQTRENNPSNTNNATRVWGPTLKWGVGLSDRIDVHCVGTSLGGDALYPGDVTEDHDGMYTVTYHPKGGDSPMRLFVQLNNENIPGSPFFVYLQPTSIAPDKCQAYNLETAVRLGPSPFYVELADVYYNWLTVGGSAMNISVGYTLGEDDIYILPLEYRVQDFDNGTYEVIYIAPDYSSFWLHVMYDDYEFEFSPFQVQALDALMVSPTAIDVIEGFTVLALIITLVLALAVWKWRNSVALKVATPVFLEFMLMGAALALASIFFLASKSTMGCRVFPILLSQGFVMLLGSLYIKTYRLMVIFRQKQLRAIRIGLTQMTTVLAVLVGADLIFNLIWLAVAPVTPEIKDAATWPLTYVECGGKDFSAWAGASYIVKGLFLFYGVFLAIMTRGLPSAYGEAAYIGVSIYNIAFSACLALPVMYLVSSEETLTAMFVLTSSVILWTVLCTFLLLVAPRLYYLYKDIAPEKRFLDEMGYDPKAGTYNPRGKTAGTGTSKTGSKLSSKTQTPSQTTKNTTLQSATEPLMNYNEISTSPPIMLGAHDGGGERVGILEMHQSLYNGVEDEEEEDGGVDSSADSSRYARLKEYDETTRLTQQAAYNKSDVVTDHSEHDSQMGNEENIGDYVPPEPRILIPSPHQQKPPLTSSSSKDAQLLGASSGKYSGIHTLRSSLENR